MKTVLLASVLLSVAPVAAHAQSSNQAQSVEELTRRLNGGPPTAPRVAAPPSQPSTSASSASAPVRPTSATTSTAPVQPRPQPPRIAGQAPIGSPRPQATQGAPAPVPAPSAPVRRSDAPSSASSAGLSFAERAALPFSIDMPADFQLVEGRGAPNTHVYSVRKAGKTFAMIYTGPASQFPIYDGEQVTAAGRVSVIVPEGTRRIAMEHLFQQPTAPNEIHVWLMSLSGADRDAAERIAQSVDPK